MAFAITTTNIRLDGSILRGTCKNGKGVPVRSRLDLNLGIGNNNGKFNIFGTNFTSTARDIYLKDDTLYATLCTSSGIWTQATINLNLCVKNENGELKFEKHSDRITISGGALFLVGSVLHGLCLGPDGKMHATEIDLNDHYSNRNASFVSANKNFYKTSDKKLKLNIKNGAAMLRCKLLNYDKDYQYADVDISICIVNHSGRFAFVEHDSAFGRDGFFTRFFEHVPFVGFVVAGLHYAAGNDEWGKRAIAFCANSSIVCTGIFIGACLGGPVGAAIGAGITTPVAIVVEKLIAGTIKDPVLKGQFEEATIGRFIYETLRNVLAAGAAGMIAKFVGNLSTTSYELAAQQLREAFLRWTPPLAGTTADLVSYVLLKKIMDALVKGALPEEWLRAEANVKKLA